MCVLRGCAGDSNAGVVALSVYMGGTRGSGVLSSAGDVLEMSVVRGVCVWLGAGYEVLGVRGLGLGFTNPGGTGESGICIIGWLDPSGLGTIVQSPIDHGYSC